MRFNDWKSTRRTLTGDAATAAAEQHWGFAPTGMTRINVYGSPDDTTAVIACVGGDQWYSLCDRSEYTGALDDVEAAVWRPTPVAVAQRFDQLLREEIGDANYSEAVARNRTPEYANGVCASHDFCDANMTMLAAMIDCGIDEDAAADAHGTLFNEAWNLWREMTK